MSLKKELHDYLESLISCWLLSLREEDCIKGNIVYVFESQKERMKVTIRYLITIKKELRKRAIDDTRVATGVISLNIVRRLLVNKNRKRLISEKKEFKKMEILLRRTIEEKPIAGKQNEEAFLIDILLAEAPKGSVPIYLLEVSHVKIKRLIDEVKNDINELYKRLSLNTFELSDISFKISARKSKLDVVKIFGIAVAQIVGQALDRDALDTTLLEYKRIYGFEEKEFLGMFKNLYLRAYARAIISITKYLELLMNKYERKELYNAFIKAFARGYNKSMEKKLVIYVKLLMQVAKKLEQEKVLKKSEYRAFEVILRDLLRGTSLDIRKVKTEKKRTKSSRILDIVREYKPIIDNLDSILDKVKDIANAENGLEEFESFLEVLFTEELTKEPEFHMGEKILLAFILTVYSYNDDVDRRRELLKKIYALVPPSNNIMTQIFDTYIGAINSPSREHLYKISKIVLMLLYPLNIREEIESIKYLRYALLMSFGVKAKLLVDLNIVNKEELDALLSRFTSILTALKLDKNKALEILRGIVNV